MLNPDYRDILSAFAAGGVEYPLEGDIEVTVDGSTIPGIGGREYLKSKRATGRIRNLAVIAALGEPAD